MQYTQVYDGEFVEDKRSGPGSYTWPSGDKFEGEFLDDAKHGKGEFVFSNGNIFKVCKRVGNFHAKFL